MTRKKSRKKPGPLEIEPARVVHLGQVSWIHGDTTRTVELVAPYVPMDKIEAVGRAFTLAVAEVIGFDRAGAEVMAERVAESLRAEAAEAMKVPPPWKQRMADHEDYDDGIPF